MPEQNKVRNIQDFIKTLMMFFLHIRNTSHPIYTVY